MGAKNTKFTCLHIILLLSVTMTCFFKLNWPSCLYSVIRASLVAYCASNMARFHFVFNFLCYWNEDKVDDQGLDLGHHNLRILGRNATFCLAVDHLGLCLCGQFPSRTWHSSPRLTNHHVQGLSLDHLTMHPSQEVKQHWFNRLLSLTCIYPQSTALVYILFVCWGYCSHIIQL